MHIMDMTPYIQTQKTTISANINAVMTAPTLCIITKGRKMNGHITYFCFVTVLLAVVCVKLLPVVESMYYNLCGLWAGM